MRGQQIRVSVGKQAVTGWADRAARRLGAALIALGLWAGPAFAANVTFDFESGTTGVSDLTTGFTSVTQAKGGETYTATVSGGGKLAIATDTNIWGTNFLSGGSAQSNDISNGTEVGGFTITVAGSKSFDLAGLKICSFNGSGALTLDLTTNKGTVTTGTIQNCDALSTLTFNDSKLQGVTSVAVTRNGGGNFGYAMDDVILNNITASNTAPVFTGATTTLSVSANSGATNVKSLLTATDPDSSQTLTWTQSVAPNNGGTLTITSATLATPATGGTAGGTISYTPANNFVGTETFTVQVSDGTASATRQITVTVNKLDQTITFNNPGTQNMGTTPTLTASSTSGLSVAFTSATTGVCTITTGGVLTPVSAGTCTINANQAGTSLYNAATQVQQSFTIAKVNQTISFTGPATQTFGVAPPALSATATSGLTVAFTSATTGVCTVAGTAITLVAGGTCTINADQAGNGTYNAATQVQQSFTVNKANQTISFTGPATQTFGVAPPALSATASSGLTVAFTSATTGVCTVAGTTITLVAGGTCTINADQAGNGAYNAATQVQQSFTVNKANQTITFTNPGTQVMGTNPTLTATASSGLTVSFTSATIGVCTITTGGSLTPVSNGTCTINANQAGDGAYNAATQVQQSFAIKTNQTITFANPGAQTFGTSPTLTATSDSGLTVAFTSATTGVCTITTGGALTIVTAGTCTINADQAGNTNFNAATQVQRSFTINKANQTISFTGPATQTIGVAPPALSATSTSGLTVAFTSATTGVCTVAGTTITLVAGGTCTINADQAGDGAYNAATQVQQTVQVKTPQVITFANPGAQTFGTTPTLTATSDSGLTVAFTSATTGVCTVAGTTLTIVTTGTCTINANQAGDTTFGPALQVQRSFTINKAIQTITFPALADATFAGTAPTPGATSDSALAVSYTSATTGICTIAGSTITIVAPGTCTINAD